MEKVVNWAFAGTGGITNAFISGLKAVEGVKFAAVYSRTRNNGSDFAARHGCRHGTPKVYTSYGDLLADPGIDVIYIGTPHPVHRELTLGALKAGKAVLCEKPVTINAAELRELIACAHENKVFFMEAMWNRYTPPLVKVREWLSCGLIGEVRAVQANFGFNAPWNPAGRLLKRELGGGALLDAGVYPISFASMAFGGVKPLKVSSALVLGETGVDELVSAVLSYPQGRQAVVGSSLCVNMQNDGWIYGTQGYIHVPDVVFAHGAKLHVQGKYDYCFEGEYLANGYNYEAEEVNRCLREGKTESGIMPLSESLTAMEIMDEIRAQGNFTYPGER
ncbi:MAG: Gfo/Idh/MocA family oxidoreductase [Treponema sp.]|nr:Gfo/Idh/MocA family oxidoreductase [Treponema sp.]